MIYPDKSELINASDFCCNSELLLAQWTLHIQRRFQAVQKTICPGETFDGINKFPVVFVPGVEAGLLSITRLKTGVELGISDFTGGYWGNMKQLIERVRRAGAHEAVPCAVALHALTFIEVITLAPAITFITENTIVIFSRTQNIIHTHN